MDNYYLVELVGKNPNSQNKFAKISLDKIDNIIKYKWYLGKNGYPFTYIEGARVQLHKFIFYLNTGSWNNKYNNIIYYVDHVNRDKLDATNENLRLATPAENSYNKTIKNSNGLHHIKLKKTGYEVCINKKNITNRINKIKTLDEAKEIYNLMVEEMFGEFGVYYK